MNIKETGHFYVVGMLQINILRILSCSLKLSWKCFRNIL